jgi:CheY-like chemotaxis protein
MVRRPRPGVLVVDGEAGNRRRIAVLLGEAGIGVTAVADGAAALAALARGRFDLAVADPSLRLDAASLGLAIVAADCRDPRRFVGRVRDRLLGAEDDAEAGEAERCIAAAKLACLDQRQHAARRAGSTGLVAALAREIAETVAFGSLPHQAGHG